MKYEYVIFNVAHGAKNRLILGRFKNLRKAIKELNGWRKYHAGQEFSPPLSYWQEVIYLTKARYTTLEN